MAPLQAAPFLREVMEKDEGNAPARELSAEQFTLAKEQERRARGAEIITAEASFQVASECLRVPSGMTALHQNSHPG
jgi:hypothetical protein